MVRKPVNMDDFSSRSVWVNDPIIVGADLSGLAVGSSCLKEKSVPCVILERADCMVTSLWQQRLYDHLKLHLPKQFCCQLRNMPFPAHYPEYPTLIGDFCGPVSHVSEYKSGETYRGRKVLVVGCSNLGMEVCLDLCDHDSFPSMVVRDTIHVLPREVLGKSTVVELAVFFMKSLPLRMVDKLIMLISAWLVSGNLENIGLKRLSMGPLELKNVSGRTSPVIDYGALSKIRSGDIKVVPGVERFWSKSVQLVDGSIVDIDAVILATRYRSNVPQWLQETDFFNKNKFPKGNNNWKGKSGRSVNVCSWSHKERPCRRRLPPLRLNQPYKMVVIQKNIGDKKSKVIQSYKMVA